MKSIEWKNKIICKICTQAQQIFCGKYTNSCKSYSNKLSYVYDLNKIICLFGAAICVFKSMIFLLFLVWS